VREVVVLIASPFDTANEIKRYLPDNESIDGTVFVVSRPTPALAFSERFDGLDAEEDLHPAMVQAFDLNLEPRRDSRSLLVNLRIGIHPLHLRLRT
jgi:hypothetical protein